MTETRGGLPWREPPLRREPVKIQGITVHPGDQLLVTCRGQKYLMPFAGWARIPAGLYDNETEVDGYWMAIERGTGPGMDPGPYPIEALSHPKLLDGIIKEIDAAE